MKLREPQVGSDGDSGEMTATRLERYFGGGISRGGFRLGMCARGISTEEDISGCYSCDFCRFAVCFMVVMEDCAIQRD